MGRFLGIVEVVGALAAVLLISTLVVGLGTGWSGPPSTLAEMTPGSIAFVLVVQSLVMLAVGLTLVAIRGTRIADRVRATRVTAVLLGAVFALVALAVTMLVETAQAWAGLPAEEQAWVARVVRPDATALLVVPVLVLVVPAAEEIFFRGYVLGFITRKISAPAGYLVSSFLFAVVHLNPSAFLVYLAYGLVLADGYRRTGRLETPITAHMLINSVNVATLLLTS